MHTLSSQVLFTKLAAIVFAATIVAISFPAVSVSAQEKLKVEDVVAKHLEALGSAEARNKSRIIQGTAVGTFRLGGSGSAEGGAVIASQDVKSLVSIVFEATIVAISFPAVSVSAQEKLKVEDVVAKHLEALGSAEARNKSRIIQGTAVGTFRLGGSGSAEGGAVIASQDVKSLVSIVF